MVAAAVKQFGSVDILVNNAGIEQPSVLTRSSPRSSGTES